MSEWVLCWTQDNKIRCSRAFDSAQSAHQDTLNSLPQEIRTAHGFKTALLDFYSWTPMWWREHRIQRSLVAPVQYENAL